jgi:hypothetical protein
MAFIAKLMVAATVWLRLNGLLNSDVSSSTVPSHPMRQVCPDLLGRSSCREH